MCNYIFIIHFIAVAPMISTWKLLLVLHHICMFRDESHEGVVQRSGGFINELLSTTTNEDGGSLRFLLRDEICVIC